jgi:hypothetical protein
VGDTEHTLTGYRRHGFDKPLVPLAIALPRMVEKVRVELATARPAEAQYLRHRAQLILNLLTPRGQPITA